MPSDRTGGAERRRPPRPKAEARTAGTGRKPVSDRRFEGATAGRRRREAANGGADAKRQPPPIAKTGPGAEPTRDRFFARRPCCKANQSRAEGEGPESYDNRYNVKAVQPIGNKLGENTFGKVRD